MSSRVKLNRQMRRASTYGHIGSRHPTSIKSIWKTVNKRRMFASYHSIQEARRVFRKMTKVSTAMTSTATIAIDQNKGMINYASSITQMVMNFYGDFINKYTGLSAAMDSFINNELSVILEFYAPLRVPKAASATVQELYNLQSELDSAFGIDDAEGIRIGREFISILKRY